MTTNDHKSPNLVSKIVNESGEAFIFGLAISGPYQFYKGSRAMWSGSRLTGGIQRMRMITPQIGGSFAAYFAMVAAAESASAHLRRNEDCWNRIIGWAIASGVGSLRRGLKPASKEFVKGGMIMGLIDGCFHVVERFVDKEPQNKKISE